MKFGIFFELSVPRPFEGDIERTVYHNALEQVRLADELGFSTAWAVEHHFLEEYSHCSAPEVFLAACAAQTKNIRIGHGAVVTVPEMNHPIRVAERAAALDIISDGRLEFGTARSSTWTELGGFQVKPDETKKTWDEFVRVLPQMWMQERFAHDGYSFSMPERAILPKPVQKPHPPMWVTVTTPGTEIDAAERGLGCLGVSSVGYADQEKRTNEYHRRVRDCEPVGGLVNNAVATLNFLYCHEDANVALERGLRFHGAFGVANAHLLWTREAFPTRAYQSMANLAGSGSGGRTARDTSSPAERRGAPEGVGIGDPEQIFKAVKHWESVGVDQINFLLNGLETIPQDAVLESLRLFAREVMPVFAEKPSTAATEGR